MKNNEIIPPSTFILGAPKCGTTSLASYLSAHPEIAPPKVKEPNFFSTDLPMLQEVSSKKEYLKLFKRTNDTQKISFEASTWYLYSNEAVKNIIRFCPKAKFIVMIRNPIEMVQSLHSQQVYNLNEKISNFEEAWNLQFKEERKNKWLLQYKKCCLTGTQLDSLFATVRHSQVKVILFDEFKLDPEKVFLETQMFIGLNEFKLDDYSSRNKNKILKSIKLQEFLKKTPTPIDTLWKSLKKLIGIQKIGLFEKIEELNRKEKTRDILSEDFRKVLLKEFISEIEKLEFILKKDLSHWKA